MPSSTSSGSSAPERSSRWIIGAITDLSRGGWFQAVVARLFGPAIFEASKLKVLFLGVDQEKHPGHLPRAYTLTHSDITAKITLAVSQTINRSQVGDPPFFFFFLLLLRRRRWCSWRVFGFCGWWLQLQGWYNRLQRDEVVAEWKKVQGHMSLHVHCHISGGHVLLDFIAKLRYYIFSKELPVVRSYRSGS